MKNLIRFNPAHPVVLPTPGPYCLRYNIPPDTEFKITGKTSEGVKIDYTINKPSVVIGTTGTNSDIEIPDSGGPYFCKIHFTNRGPVITSFSIGSIWLNGKCLQKGTPTPLEPDSLIDLLSSALLFRAIYKNDQK